MMMMMAAVPAEEQLAPTPPMGWNSWNWWGKNNINEQVVRDTIDAMVEKGLLAVGYEYIVVDGGWRTTKLTDQGQLIAHPEKFPSGMKALADYAHAKGFKFGLHTCPGTHDAGGDKVGSWGIEEIHFNQCVEWGLDFIKLDKCQFHVPGASEPLTKKDRYDGWNIGSNLVDAYTRWYNLIKASGRPIVFSASAQTFYEWYPKLTQMGRTTGDVGARSQGGARFDEAPPVNYSVMANAEKNNDFIAYADNGYWNDPDMLVTGDQGLTLEEQKAHFALWCIMTSPLMLGSDPITMSNEELKIVANKTAIAINQDPAEQGKRIVQNGTAEIWVKKLTDGKVAALLLNRDKQRTQNIVLPFKQIGIKDEQSVLDVYENTPLGKMTGSLIREVPPSAGFFVLIGE